VTETQTHATRNATPISASLLAGMQANPGLRALVGPTERALAAERRATVERIRGFVKAKRAMYFSQTDSANTLNDVLRMLDEEAAR
jgi:hypothetical protein